MPFYGTLPGIFTIKPERSLFLYSSTYIWAKVLAHMEQKLTDTIVTTWFDDTEVLELTDQKLVLYSPTVFRKDMIVSRCETYIRDALKELFDMDLELVVLDDTEIEAYRSSKKKPRFIEFNPQFTFDNFIVGNSNKFANAAAVAVAEKPADSYNPLFIYGPSGVGKTHLLYAIANEIHKHHPDYNIVYIKGDQFTNELINSLREGKNNEFRLKYRGADLFLVDDIQFIAGKDSTQEEFFHTFNNLYESHKQIVLTSDRPPNEMVRLEDRLRTRFEWGLLADIQPPDYETRMAIIKNKAANLGFDLPDDVCNYIAENITNNVRQIEGTVKKIKAFKELNGMVLDVPNVARAIKDMFKGKTENLPTPSLIVSEVCQYYGIEEQVLRSTLKNKNTAEARQVAMYLIRTMTNLSLPEIGREFDRDHTTVMHGLKKVEQTLQNSASPLNDTIRDITANVNNKL
mgnify:FL=1